LPWKTGSKRQKPFLLQIENIEVQGTLNRVFCPVPSQVITSFLHPKSLGLRVVVPTAGEESNRIRGTKIEWTLPDPVDRFFQQPAHVINTLQRNLRKIPVFDLPVTVSLPSLPTKFGRFLGIRMKEAQPSFHSGRLAYTASLLLSLTLLTAPLFQAFPRLKAHGGTPPPSSPQLVALLVALGFAVFADLVGGPCCSWLRGGCGFCRILPDSAELGC